MEQASQSEHTPAISIEAYQLVEEYQVGLPLALYNMRPKALRIYKWYSRIMLVGGFGLLLEGVIGALVTLYQLLPLSSQHPTGPYGALELDEQISHLQNQLIEDLIPLMLGFMYSVGAIVQKRIIARGLPVYVLVCTEGLLRVDPKKVDVTRWEEVTGFYKMPGTRKKSYRLMRLGRKTLSFGEALEDVEGLADLIRRQIKTSPS